MTTETFDLNKINDSLKGKKIQYYVNALRVGEGRKMRSDVKISASKQVVWNANKRYLSEPEQFQRCFALVVKDDGSRWIVRTK